ncbi:MAG: hypothetical protein ABR585_06100 [Gemmatimonadaceae bacterium]
MESGNYITHSLNGMTHLQSAPRAAAAIRALWARRRWAYGAYMVGAILRIPARVDFRLVVPVCDTRLTLKNTGLSLTKVPHFVLFAGFFMLTAFQFDRLDQRAIRWSLLAVGVLGLVIELEEGATRTGNCRLTDVLPDIFGALLASAIIWGFMKVRRRSSRSSNGAKIDRQLPHER